MIALTACLRGKLHCKHFEQLIDGNEPLEDSSNSIVNTNLTLSNLYSVGGMQSAIPLVNGTTDQMFNLCTPQRDRTHGSRDVFSAGGRRWLCHSFGKYVSIRCWCLPCVWWVQFPRVLSQLQPPSASLLLIVLICSLCVSGSAATFEQKVQSLAC